MSSNYNSAQGFHLGKESEGKTHTHRRRSKGGSGVRDEDQNETDTMVWSPAPMDTDNAPASSVLNGFSIGKHMNSPLGRGVPRAQRHHVTIPNLPVVPPSGKQGASMSQSAMDRMNEFRRKGNHAFKMKDYEGACVKYSNAIIASLSLPEEANRAGVPLLYCNRAAAYLALGKPDDALKDCLDGMKLNPGYDKCRFRAATCLVRMGRFSEAREVVREVNGTREDRAGIKDDGGDARNDTGGCGTSGTSAEVSKRLQEIDEAERAFEVYVDALLGGQLKTIEMIKIAYKEVESMVPHAEALIVSLVVGHIQLGDFSGADKILDSVFKHRGSIPPAWAGWCRVQTCFFKADYKQCHRNLEALESLVERLPVSCGQCGVDASVSRVSSLPDKSTIKSLREDIWRLQGLKDQAQARMHQRDFGEAIELYTRALSSPQLSPAMSAILFSNRAAAYQSNGQHALALADCCMAVAISPHFAKPHSRMASLLSDLGLYLDAQKSIERAVGCAASASQRAQYQNAMNAIIHHRHQQMDHARLLGLDHGASGLDAKRAYRKLALKLHPDKTSQTMNKVRFQLTPAGALLGTAQETQRQMLAHATWLFKQVGEAQDAMTM